MLRCLLIAIAVSGGLVAGPATAEDKVIAFSDADPVMNRAIAKARSSLPGFWSHFASPALGESDFNLKLAVADGDNVEHFWCDQIEGDALKATCTIANDAVTVHNVQFGQRVDVDPEQISDWMYFVHGRIKGAQTLRAILPRLPADEAAQYRALLLEE